ncbi:MAG: spore cortex biosynthesis protein YabQ [Clostridia bacterium]
MSNTLSELPVFLGAVYGGIIIGILFDLFRLLHLPVRARWLHTVIDVLFYAASGAAASLMLLRLNGGAPRLYIFIGFAIGIFAYQRTISALIRAVITKK